MKIAVVIDTWFPAIGGGQINAWEISKRIAQQGHKIDIITRNNGSYKQETIKNLRVIQLGFKSNPQDNLSRIFFLARTFFYLKKEDYDLIHLQAFLPGLISLPIRYLLKKQTVFTVHGTSIGTNLLNPVNKKIEEIILTKIKYDIQITVSRDFLRFKNINKNVTYIPNGVDIKAFDKVHATKFKEPTLIFVGRLHPQKNLKNLIEAINIVKRKMPDINLLIIGKGALKKELHDEVKRLKLQRNVKFLGERAGKDLIKLYKSSHAFILPSIYEGQPLSLLEAWAAKLPVIISNFGDAPYIVKNGYFLKGLDSTSIQKSILFAFKNRRNLRELGLNGYNAVKDFTWGQSALKTLDVYKLLLHN